MSTEPAETPPGGEPATAREHGASVRDEVHVMLGRLRSEHALLESQLDVLKSRLYLSAREQMEVARLKKLKLSTKDRIARLESQGSRTAGP